MIDLSLPPFMFFFSIYCFFTVLPIECPPLLSLTKQITPNQPCDQPHHQDFFSGGGGDDRVRRGVMAFSPKAGGESCWWVWCVAAFLSTGQPARPTSSPPPSFPVWWVWWAAASLLTSQAGQWEVKQPSMMLTSSPPHKAF